MLEAEGLISGAAEGINLVCHVQAGSSPGRQGQTHCSFSERSWRYKEGIGDISPWDLSVPTHSSESNSVLSFP